MRKYLSVVISILLMATELTAQEKDSSTIDSSVIIYQGLSLDECPPAFTVSLDKNLLTNKAALIILNEALHPLGRGEFYEDGKPVRWLKTPLRMNRASLLYIDTGEHRYHTMYQRLYHPARYEAGRVYLARLFSRKQWLLGGLSIIKKDEQGRPVEYAAVLLEYISPETATELFNKMNKKEMIVNQ